MSDPDRDARLVAPIGDPVERDPEFYDGGKSPEAIEQDIARTRANLSDTLDALEQKLAPRHLMEKGVDMFKDAINGNIDTARIGDVMRDNPVPLALIGIGLGWLLFHNVPATRGTAHRASRWAREGLGDAVGGVSERVKGWVGGEEERTSHGHGVGGGRTMTENERHMAGAARATGTGPASAGIVEKARTAAGDAYGAARDTVAETGSKAWRAVGDYAGQAGDYAGQAVRPVYKAKARFVQVMEDYPLAVGALGFIAGAVIAAALPSTRYEDELLGETRDELWRQGEQVAREGWERAQEAATAAAGAATEAVKETAREVADTVKDKAQDAVEAARRSAQSTLGDEAEKKSEGQRSGSGFAGPTGSTGTMAGNDIGRNSASRQPGLSPATPTAGMAGSKPGGTGGSAEQTSSGDKGSTLGTSGQQTWPQQSGPKKI
jgi:hypothetical protein